MKNLIFTSSQFRFFKFSCFFILLFCFNAKLKSQTQQRLWYMGDLQLDMHTTTPPAPGSTGAPKGNYTGNGAYYTDGTNYTTEFTVSDNAQLSGGGLIGSMDVYEKDENGTLQSIDLYSIINTSNGDASNVTTPGSEIGIVPKPGSECSKYYLIYARSFSQAGAVHNAGSDLYYNEYDADPTQRTLSYYTLGADIQGTAISSAYSTFLTSFFTPVFAISKKDAATGERYLYAAVPVVQSGVEWTYVYKYVINAAGINTTGTYITSFEGDIAPHEMELSPDGGWLAFARGNGAGINTKDLVLIKIDPATHNLYNNSQSYVFSYSFFNPDDYFSGIEFDATSAKLYLNRATNNPGIYTFDIATSTLLPGIIFGSDAYPNSELELANNGYICAVRNDAGTYKMGGFNPALPNPSMASFNNLHFAWQAIYGGYPKVNGVYSLPEQLDGEDYNTWSDPNNSTACCTRYYESPYKDVTAENRSNSPGSNQFGNTNGDVIIENSFTVPSGVICTLSNMVLRFHPGGKVVVEPNARLYLQNTKLTGLSCGTTWNGVRVLGTPSQPQQLAYQGYLNMNTGSEISHALCGAATYDKENEDLNTSGGFIQTNSVNFIDNYQDLVIPYYPSSGANPSNNFFDLTTFKVDDNYRFGTSLSYRASVSQIYRVYFRGCTFANDCTSPVMQSSTVNTTAGVVGLDAYVIVDQKTAQTPCVFRNLYQGILALKWAVNQIFIAQNSQFTNNQTGIYTGAVNNFTVYHNTFSVGSNANFSSNAGLFIATGSGFTVKDNTFTGFGNTLSTYPLSYGCIVQNTCPSGDCADNSIFRNTFSNLCFANQSQGRNRGTADTDPGLVYFCNNHSNDLIDITVLNDPNLGAVYNQGIRANQFTVSGSNAVSPENIFSQNSASGLPNPWYDIYLDQNIYLGNIAYVKDNANSNTNPWQSPQPPSVPNVSISGGQTKNCNVSNPFMLTIGQILTDNGFGSSSYETVKQQYLNAKYLHDQLIDNGNSQSVESNIDYNWSNDAWQLHNELMNLSPNLSSEVLLHAASKDILPPALLYEVCANNIRSSRSPQLLENLSSYLPAYMIDMLKNASEPGTYRKTLEEQLTNYRGQLTQAYQSVINFASGDTVDRSSLMISLLQDVPLVDAKRQLIDVYLQKKDYANATLALNDYVGQLPSGTFATQTANFLGFIIQKAPDILNLSTQDINYLQTVAADSSHSYFIQAHNILRAKGLSDYWVRPLSIPSSAHKNLVISKSSENTPSNTQLSIYPNPAGDYITAEYQYFATTNSLKIFINDYAGKEYKTVKVSADPESKNLSNINIHDLPSGNYILGLKVGIEILKTQRFTKQ